MFSLVVCSNQNITFLFLGTLNSDQSHFFHKQINFISCTMEMRRKKYEVSTTETLKVAAVPKTQGL